VKFSFLCQSSYLILKLFRPKDDYLIRALKIEWKAVLLFYSD
jgi:hypothetical protein